MTRATPRRGPRPPLAAATALLTVTLAGGCRGPVPANPPETQGAETRPPVASVDVDAPSEPKDPAPTLAEADDNPDPIQTICPARVADHPSTYMDGHVLLRLPQGLTEAEFVQVEPTMARLSKEVESVGCVEGVGGPLITFAAMLMVQDDPSKSLTAVRDQVVGLLGYKDVTFSSQTTSGRAYQAVMDVPASLDAPVARALITMVTRKGRMSILIYEVHPNAWNALRETLQQSARSMTVL